MSTISTSEFRLRKIVREELKGLMQETENFITADEAAAFLNYSLDYFYQLTSKRRLPFYKIHGHLHFKKSELIEFINKGKKSQNDQKRKDS